MPTMTKKMQRELETLQAAAISGEISEGAADRLAVLEAIVRQQAAAAGKVLNFRTMPEGKTTDRGTIGRCGVCGELGAVSTPKFANGMKMIVHSLEAMPTIQDLRRVGKNFTDAACTGNRFRLAGDFHLIALDGTPVVAREQSKAKSVDQGWDRFFSQHCDPKGLAKSRDLDLQAQPTKRKAKAVQQPTVKAKAEVPAWRREAARKAWEKIRANRAAAAQSA